MNESWKLEERGWGNSSRCVGCPIEDAGARYRDVTVTISRRVLSSG